MSPDKIQEMLNKEVKIKLNGAMVAYILGLLAREQVRLRDDVIDNPTDGFIHLKEGANSAVGNAVLLEAHANLGAEFTAFALNKQGHEKELDDLMNATSNEEVDRVAEKIGIKRSRVNAQKSERLN